MTQNKVAQRAREQLEKNPNAVPAWILRETLVELERQAAIGAAHQEAAGEFFHLATVRHNEIGRLEALVEISCNLASRARSCAAWIAEKRGEVEDGLVSGETLDRVVADLRNLVDAWDAQRAMAGTSRL